MTIVNASNYVSVLEQEPRMEDYTQQYQSTEMNYIAAIAQQVQSITNEFTQVQQTVEALRRIVSVSHDAIDELVPEYGAMYDDIFKARYLPKDTAEVEALKKELAELKASIAAITAMAQTQHRQASEADEEAFVQKAVSESKKYTNEESSQNAKNKKSEKTKNAEPRQRGLSAGEKIVSAKEFLGES